MAPEPHRRDVETSDEQLDEISIEKGFEGKSVPSWQKQVTVRAIVVSIMLSVMFTFIVMKLNLTTGIIPSLNVSAGLLGFFFVKTWTKLLEKAGWLNQPFTRQENTVIQTCVVAASGIAFSGGFGSYLFGMSPTIAKQIPEAGTANDVKSLGLGWMIAFLFVVSFLGLFSVVPLRKIMIVDFKLTYPSGTATAHLINSFHTSEGAKLAKKQVKALGKFFSFSFLWGFFQWFFAAGDSCGFTNFPTFGLEAYQRKFYFDFSATYVGVGMICPYIINISLLIGGVLSWGVMWPLIGAKKGDWFPADLKESSLHGLQGYRVFIGIAMILGDGLYNFVKVLGTTLIGLYKQLKKKDKGAQSEDPNAPLPPTLSFDDKRRTEMFLKDQIPSWFAIAGYVIIAIISIITIPHIFHQLKWYHIICIYIIAPALAFCNAYGCGLTDWSLASTYGKLAIFIIGAWAGPANGGILASLAACGVMMNIVSTASDLMQDFKTGYMTLASPKSMFVSQVIGTAIGCVVSPCVFWLFYHAFGTLGQPGSAYPAPYALVYRNIAILGVDGFSALPKNCLVLCIIFFTGAIIINFVRDLVGKKYAKYIPVPMAMAIPFYIGSYFAIDMCVGSLILFIWQKLDRAKADAFASAVASGLICGDGIWSLPSSFLALAGVQPPICMKFLSRAANAKVDGFLES
ncbi:putative oligopeptide transporter, OPT superfamily [Medicago truncatula]|uniref:OPT family oligopeptide transporter n=1 Tax=Medicago truncatula TaxID=3880 RepID=G7KD70_MEDTR|nr:probable metal-nicotianamine transporter YSL7 [Medicago truncatula]AET00398.2 OPT family oligopeptide transporter [Medicago truncatula]RHN57698.1 putative oligopeptide transporter, OPT superfamily [Medicago truncatula]